MDKSWMEIFFPYFSRESIMLIGNWKLIFERNGCLITVLISESVIFCGNCVEYCPTNCLSMTEEYELSTYDRHDLNYNQIALGRLPMSGIDDSTIRIILNSPQIK
uniref:NdhI n=1 Tax=Sarracenia alata TaxID=50001 RepID=UPI0022A74718|nr:NdhI [Sarracenia alata]YP_010581043.1 NdhI [Sarracenia alata]UZT27368.1 NdhI [Sarracenia alata]UZT27370.1 NdhI [Sarracenia alata]